MLNNLVFTERPLIPVAAGGKGRSFIMKIYLFIDENIMAYNIGLI
jgi:hypothetical protein